MARVCLSVASLVSMLLLGTHCAEVTGGTGGTGGTAGTAGTAGTPISACPRSVEAVTFCSNAQGKYEDVCGFGGPDRFVNRVDCENTYDAHKESNRACVEDHLGFAAAGAPDTHCPHATGHAPCNNSGAASPEAISFCDDYETACGFRGADRYENQGVCEGAFDSFDETRQTCVKQHLGFAAAGDPGTHCPHAAGQADATGHAPCEEVCGGMGGRAGVGGMGGRAGAGGMGGRAGAGGMGGRAGAGGMGGMAGVGGVGGTPPIPSTCAAVLANDPRATDRVYTIDPDQSGPMPPVDTYCDMTTDRGGWTQLYDQDVTVMGGYLPPTTWAAGVTNTVPNGGQFSILQLTSYFSQGGEYELLIDWDDRTNYVQWVQTENPLVGRGTVSNIVQSPTNQLGCDTFDGLGPDGDGPSLLDGSGGDNSCWWWAIGTSAGFDLGIPTYRIPPNTHLSAMRTRLWVR